MPARAAVGVAATLAFTLIATPVAANGSRVAVPGTHGHVGQRTVRQLDTVPSLTSQGRFVYGPAFGHPPILGADLAHIPVRRGRPLAAAIVVPGYYPAPAYAYPPELPLPAGDAPPAAGYPPPMIAYVPVPYTDTQAMRPAPAAPAKATPIYYCAELHAYTNERDSMECPKGWRRMTR